MKKIEYRPVLLNYDVKNTNEYGVTVIGDPNHSDIRMSQLVMNFSRETVSMYYQGEINKSTTEEEKERYQFMLDSIPKTNDITCPYYVNINREKFNKLAPKVPINILPRTIPSGEITINSVYRMISEPAKIVISKNILYNVGYLKGKIERVSSRFPIKGIPTKYMGDSMFDCEIQLDQFSVSQLIMEDGLRIGSQYFPDAAIKRFKKIQKGLNP